jgi:hypothetical protein
MDDLCVPVEVNGEPALEVGGRWEVGVQCSGLVLPPGESVPLNSVGAFAEPVDRAPSRQRVPAVLHARILDATAWGILLGRHKALGRQIKTALGALPTDVHTHVPVVCLPVDLSDPCVVWSAYRSMLYHFDTASSIAARRKRVRDLEVAVLGAVPDSPDALLKLTRAQGLELWQMLTLRQRIEAARAAVLQSVVAIPNVRRPIVPGLTMTLDFQPKVPLRYTVNRTGYGAGVGAGAGVARKEPGAGAGAGGGRREAAAASAR